MKRIVRELGKLNWAKRACGVFVLCMMTAIALAAQTFTSLYSFDVTDGGLPYAALVQATNGDLYGTTVDGGASGYGTVFKITPGGTLTTLYSFCSQTGCIDGEHPYAGLVQATNGDLYGTTSLGGGGTYDNAIAYAGGTVFKITPGGTLTTLYNFCSQSNCTDGSYPNAGLVQATNGDLYGTTTGGGIYDNAIAYAGGTVFKITPGGTLTTLYSFCSQSNCMDGVASGNRYVDSTDCAGMSVFNTQLLTVSCKALYWMLGNEDNFYSTPPFSFSNCPSPFSFDCNDLVVTQKSAFALDYVDNSTAYSYPTVILNPVRKNHSTVGDSCVSGGGASCTTGSGVLGAIRQLQPMQ
jgi:uncharacterized repeat protein (TIGR03803 family)